MRLLQQFKPDAMQMVHKLCYLCGETITTDMTNDHVPPRQFYSQEIRSHHNPNLLTLPTHGTCNKSYQLDEEYFIHAIGPLTMESHSGGSLFRELSGQYREGRNVPLHRRIFSEFETQPSGLILPGGKVVKRFDPERVWRVVWKITRGLYFHEYGNFLPESTPRLFEVVSPGEKPPDAFFLLPDEPVRGLYPGVFDYKFRQFAEFNNSHLWAMLFWDRLIVLVVFHDPSCRCETCTDT